MSAFPIGNVAELPPDDKYPGVYLKSTVEVGSSVGPFYMLVVGAPSDDGAIATNTDVVDIVTDADALYWAGANSEGYRMLMRALGVGGLRLKYAAPTISGGAKATATITVDVDGSLSETGSIFYRLGGRPVGPIGITLADTPQTIADAIAAFINADPLFCATASVSAGAGTSYEIALTAASDGARGNQLVIWQDTSNAPTEFSSSLGGDAGGSTVSAAGPWALADGLNLVVAFNAGGDQTFTIHATAATKTGSGATYAAVTAGHTLTLTLSGVQYVVTFTGSENSQATFHNTINAKISNDGFASNSGGQTRITTTKKGSTADGTIDAGDSDVLASLGLSVGAFTNAGPNNVANNAAITAAEWVTIMAAITNGTAEDDGGALRLTSVTTGTSGTAQVKSASTADSLMGFDNNVHTGTTGGDALASGARYFETGGGTEDVTTLMATLQNQEFFTNAISQRDSTNLARWETAIDAKLGPLVGLLENVVCAAVGTLSASGSLAQTTLNNSSFQMLWFEESEVPGEELAALVGAMRHQLEIQHPNRRYDLVKLANVQPQEARSKQPSRATCVAALNYGLTPIETRNAAAYLVRAVTTRTQTDLGGTDDGTVDVAQWRTALEFRRRLKAMLDQHLADHQYVIDDPAEGDEPDVKAGTTYPKNIATDTWKLEYQLQNDDWLAQVKDNRPRCALHPTASTPRPVLYAPIVVKPLLHQVAGTVALRRFQVNAA